MEWTLDPITRLMDGPAARLGLYRRSGGGWGIAWILPKPPFTPADTPRIVADAKRYLVEDQQGQESRDTTE